MYLQGSEIWHPHCSEEFQRENEELERLNASQNNDELPSPHLRVHVTSESHQPQLESPSPENGNKRFNGFNNHNEHPSNSSEPETEVKKPTTWNPKPKSTSSAQPKPAGFRSVKPPQQVVSKSQDVSDEDEPPPVPPPPSRSSSSAWKQKYSQPVKSTTVSTLCVFVCL